jgi:hypothetical protein
MFKKALTAVALATAALAVSVPQASASVQEVRWQCGADSVTVRYSPGGAAIPGEVIGYGVRVNVTDHYDNVWWHINSPYGGWVLAQYFC